MKITFSGFSKLLIVISILAGPSGCVQYQSPLVANQIVPINDDIIKVTYRDIDQGSLTGIRKSNGSYAWLGIPYAKPPIDSRRWQPPLPPKKWENQFYAATIGSPCIQPSGRLTSDIDDPDSEAFVGSENCLFLNIFAPAGAIKDNPLPVMLWIHGGGNLEGHGGNYDGSSIAATQNIIVVTINYRLGPFGWFLHPSIIKENASGQESSGNWGTLDIIRSLEWVQENIASFGGNPNKVMIAGESAGGFNVISLLLSPLAKDLFHSAVSQSGAVAMSSRSEVSNYQEQSGYPASSRELINKILIRTGKAEDRNAAIKVQMTLSNEEIRSLLYLQSPEEMLSLYDDKTLWKGGFIRDGFVLPDQPVNELFLSGGYNQVPIILGTNRDEKRIDGVWVEGEMRKLFDESPSDYILINKYASEAWKVQGVDSLANILSQTQRDKVFTYRFDWAEEGSRDGRDYGLLAGAYHTLELPFLFGDWTVGGIILEENRNTILPPELHSSITSLSNSMMSYWAAMAIDGKPGSGQDNRQVEWGAWVPGNGRNKMLILDSKNDGGIRMSDFQLTQKDIRRKLLADTTFKTQKAHCWAYVKTFPQHPWQPDFAFNAIEYASLGREGCSAYPPDNF